MSRDQSNFAVTHSTSDQHPLPVDAADLVLVRPCTANDRGSHILAVVITASYAFLTFRILQTSRASIGLMASQIEPSTDHISPYRWSVKEPVSTAGRANDQAVAVASRGSFMQNLEPWPSSLSRMISPCSTSTNCRTMARPSPAPS
jgi:hypothetical protein